MVYSEGQDWLWSKAFIVIKRTETYDSRKKSKEETSCAQTRKKTAIWERKEGQDPFIVGKLVQKESPTISRKLDKGKNQKIREGQRLDVGGGGPLATDFGKAKRMKQIQKIKRVIPETRGRIDDRVKGNSKVVTALSHRNHDVRKI